MNPPDSEVMSAEEVTKKIIEAWVDDGIEYSGLIKSRDRAITAELSHMIGTLMGIVSQSSGWKSYRPDMEKANALIAKYQGDAG